MRWPHAALITNKRIGVWCTKKVKNIHPKVDIKSKHHQNNDRTKLDTGAGVVLARNTFSPRFFPRVCWGPRDPAGGYQVAGRAGEELVCPPTLSI